MVEDGCAENAISLLILASSVLGKVLKYCKKHIDDKEGDPKTWDTNYIKVDHN
ncbi:putative chromatin remodeling & transcription regulator BTB-POZ family [Rosa chinensis]|uniref:Putative chromatin remodeling & transcription regulator BTB-POZ family n=1 Tax=Rosa chinensis TaxID=74649 RepID=A0A2P6RW82_ROSCH|nr:putative chromatin remodeling & transcription regulator BTB-POZ family [Rosa chinensis]